jgi:hypothetical protein
MTDRPRSLESPRQYRTEPAPDGASDIVHVASNRRCRVQSETIARLAVACLEAGEYSRAQRLLHSPVSGVVGQRNGEGGGLDPGTP